MITLTVVDLHTEGNPTPAANWCGSKEHGFCLTWSPTNLSQCVGKPGHAGGHNSLAEDWTGCPNVSPIPVRA